MRFEVAEKFQANAGQVTSFLMVKQPSSQFDNLFIGTDIGKVAYFACPNDCVPHNIRPVELTKEAEVQHTAEVTCMMFSDSRHYLHGGSTGLLFTGSLDRTIKVWDTSNIMRPLIQTIFGHSGAITCIVDGREGAILSCSMDGSLRVWSPQTARSMMLNPFFECIINLNFGKEIWLTALTISCMGPWLCYVGDSVGNINVYQKKNASLQYDGEAFGSITKFETWSKVHQLGIKSLQIIHDDEYLLISLAADGYCKVLDPASGQVLYAIQNPRRCMYAGAMWNHEASAIFLTDEFGYLDNFSLFHEKITDSACLVPGLTMRRNAEVRRSHSGQALGIITKFTQNGYILVLVAHSLVQICRQSAPVGEPTITTEEESKKFGSKVVPQQPRSGNVRADRLRQQKASSLLKSAPTSAIGVKGEVMLCSISVDAICQEFLGHEGAVLHIATPSNFHRNSAFAAAAASLGVSVPFSIEDDTRSMHSNNNNAQKLNRAPAHHYRFKNYELNATDGGASCNSTTIANGTSSNSIAISIFQEPATIKHDNSKGRNDEDFSAVIGQLKKNISHTKSSAARLVSQEERLFYSIGAEDFSIRCWDEYDRSENYQFVVGSGGKNVRSRNSANRKASNQQSIKSEFTAAVALWHLNSIATGHENGSVCVWNMDTGNRVYSCGVFESAVSALHEVHSLHSRMLVGADYNGRVALWNLTLHALRPNQLPLEVVSDGYHLLEDPGILSLAFHERTRTMFSGGNDNTIRYWSLATSTNTTLGSSNGVPSTSGTANKSASGNVPTSGSCLSIHNNEVCFMKCSDSFLLSADVTGFLVLSKPILSETGKGINEEMHQSFGNSHNGKIQHPPDYADTFHNSIHINQQSIYRLQVMCSWFAHSPEPDTTVLSLTAAKTFPTADLLEIDPQCALVLQIGTGSHCGRSHLWKIQAKKKNNDMLTHNTISVTRRQRGHHNALLSVDDVDTEALVEQHMIAMNSKNIQTHHTQGNARNPTLMKQTALSNECETNTVEIPLSPNDSSPLREGNRNTSSLKKNGGSHEVEISTNISQQTLKETDNLVAGDETVRHDGNDDIDTIDSSSASVDHAPRDFNIETYHSNFPLLHLSVTQNTTLIHDKFPVITCCSLNMSKPTNNTISSSGGNDNFQAKQNTDDSSKTTVGFQVFLGTSLGPILRYTV